MQTGPRTASAARRCSGFRPSRTSTGPRYRPVLTVAVPKRKLLVKRVLELGLALDDGCDSAWLLGRRRSEPRHHLERVPGGGEAFELGQHVLEPPRVDGRPRRAKDLRVPGRRHALVLRPELLVQLLARAHAHVVDGDLRVRLLPREPDHVAREVDDPDG